MIEILIIAAAFAVLYWQLKRITVVPTTTPAPLAPRPSAPKIVQLIEYADRLFVEKKWLAAEKAYLNILKLDRKNVAAYSHLGIIYSTQKNLADAIECFAIATRLRPSGTTYQNLALAYFDNHNYIKSIATFKKAIMFEPTAQRYVGLGRAHQKLGGSAEAIAAYEAARKLEPSDRITQLLEQAKSGGDTTAPPSRPKP